jgi:hypothetical protein
MRVPPHLGVRDGKEERTGIETKQDLCCTVAHMMVGRQNKPRKRARAYLNGRRGGFKEDTRTWTGVHESYVILLLLRNRGACHPHPEGRRRKGRRNICMQEVV